MEATESTTTRRERCRVLFFVQNIQRDLEGHALVAYHLRTRYGHDVAFCTIAELNEKALSYAPDVLVLDRLDTRMRLARLARQLGMKVVLMPTVGFVQEGLTTEARRAGALERGEEILDCCLTWGSNAREQLLDQTGLTESQVRVVGAPRFDVYSQPFLSLVRSRASLLREAGLGNPQAPLIVWSTTTSHMRTRDLEKSVRGAVASGVPEAVIRAQIADEGTSYRDLSHVVTTLAARHPEWNFLIKLHPSELRGPYLELAQQGSNIGLVSDVRIRDVLYHCDALLTHCSTTGTEAWMLGKPVLEVIIGHYEVPSPREYLEASHVVTEIGQIERLLERYLGDPHATVPDDQRRTRDEFLARLYYRLDGKSSERCAREIDRLLAPAEHTGAQQAQIRAAAKAAYAEWRRGDGGSTGKRVRRALGLPATMPLRFWQRRFWERLLGRGEQPFAWERTITSEMIRELYRQYDLVLQSQERPRADSAAAASG